MILSWCYYKLSYFCSDFLPISLNVLKKLNRIFNEKQDWIKSVESIQIEDIGPD